MQSSSSTLLSCSFVLSLFFISLQNDSGARRGQTDSFADGNRERRQNGKFVRPEWRGRTETTPAHGVEPVDHHTPAKTCTSKKHAKVFLEKGTILTFCANRPNYKEKNGQFAFWAKNPPIRMFVILLLFRVLGRQRGMTSFSSNPG